MSRNSKPGPARIAPLANLPLFHRFKGRKAVVVGSSEGADWKAELLRAAGAEVARLSSGYRLSDLEGAAIAIADLSDREEAEAFAAAARLSGAIVSVIDQGDLSDVQFGTIVNRSPVVIGISTDGAAPMLGQSIRSRIEAVVPRGLSAWARVARQWRWALKERVPAFPDRRAFWKRFVEAAWAAPETPPGHEELSGILKDALPSKGQVTLVGAGPGDPDLLTLKALGALQEATVILYDNLVSDEVLELGRREARRIAVGKIGHGLMYGEIEFFCTLDEILPPPVEFLSFPRCYGAFVNTEPPIGDHQVGIDAEYLGKSFTGSTSSEGIVE